MDIPVLCLDTCVILDMFRDPARSDSRVHEQESSLRLLEAAESGTHLAALIAEQVTFEFHDHADLVQEAARKSLEKQKTKIAKLNSIVAVYGPPGLIDLNNWNDHDRRCRDTANRWFQAGTKISQSPDTVNKAFLRVNQARTPAKRGKQSMKDCVILETYLDYVRTLRANGRTATAVFVSSNIRDYGADDRTTVKDDVKAEFRSLGLEYAPNMGAARSLLGL